jgi:hypothetical protein
MRLWRVLLISLALRAAPAFADRDRFPVCFDFKRDIESLLTHDECFTSADCAAVDLPQPYGCNREVNKSAVDLIESTFADYNDLCGPFLFNCTAHARSIWCRNGRCEARITLDRRYPAINPLNSNGRPLR